VPESRRATIALTALVAIAMTAAPGAAEAKKKPRHHKLGPVVTSQATTSANPANPGQATATCPGKTRAVSGGFSETPANTELMGLVYESQMIGSNAWRVSVLAFDPGPPSGSISLTAFVYCRRNAPKTKVISAPVTTPPALQVGPSATASCPGKRKAVAGGFATDGAPIRTIVVESLLSPPAGWRSNVLSAGGGAGTLTGYVYCAKRKKPLAAPAATSPQTLDLNQARSATALCATSKQSAVSGGFSQSPLNVNGDGNYFSIYESQRVGNGWRVSGFFGSGNTPATVTATVYCA
jgi:hypothetical protein